jgi:drug/metabolite transporter (DMT)-like permease
VVPAVFLRKLLPLLGYSSGSLLCFGTAIASSGLLYRETMPLRVVIFLLLTLSGTAGGFYLYFRTLKEISQRPGRFSNVLRPKP